MGLPVEQQRSALPRASLALPPVSACNSNLLDLIQTSIIYGIYERPQGSARRTRTNAYRSMLCDPVGTVYYAIACICMHRTYTYRHNTQYICSTAYALHSTTLQYKPLVFTHPSLTQEYCMAGLGSAAEVQETFLYVLQAERSPPYFGLVLSRQGGWVHSDLSQGTGSTAISVPNTRLAWSMI